MKKLDGRFILASAWGKSAAEAELTALLATRPLSPHRPYDEQACEPAIDLVPGFSVRVRMVPVSASSILHPEFVDV